MKTQRILVTGINGFVGKHLARELHARGVEVVGVTNFAVDPEIAGLLHSFVNCELTNPKSVAAIDFGSFDAVIHLAALSSQAMSFEQPHMFISENSAMVINLFEAVLTQKPAQKPRFVLVSTGAVYDNDQPMPLTENSKVTHGSPYAISKLLGEMLGDYYQKRGIDSITVRPFNHTGPGQGPGFILPDMVKQISEAGKSGVLKVGNIKTRRDYSDVRDVVKAYAELATAKEVKSNLYNICRGKSYSGQEIVDAVAKSLYGNGAKLTIEIDESRIRPNDPSEIYGDNSRIKYDLGWEPTIPLEQTVQDYVDWFKEHPF